MPKILIIDDDPDVRTILTVLLRKHGYQVETASNRQEARSKLKSFQPSAVLLDVLLSGTDGRQLCMEIKNDQDLRTLPVIMVSAHPGAAENISSYGADDFISKPINADSLLKKIAGLINVAR